MFRRKLEALEYHSSATFDLQKSSDLKALVVWLEDQKIRHYKIDERGPLRDQPEGEAWTTVFRKYLTDLECPYDLNMQSTAALDWLLGVAVRYEFGDAAGENPTLRQGLLPPDAPKGAVITASISSDLPPSLNIDPSDQTFVAGVQALAKIVKVSAHPDPVVLLEAVRLVIVEKLSAESLEAAREREKKGENLKHYDVTAKECGFDLGDPVMSEAAKVLRLLHIRELRYLQTHINEMIVAVQAVTANPKTDQSLGQVGR